MSTLFKIRKITEDKLCVSIYSYGNKSILRIRRNLIKPQDREIIYNIITFNNIKDKNNISQEQNEYVVNLDNKTEFYMNSDLIVITSFRDNLIVNVPIKDNISKLDGIKKFLKFFL